MFYISTRSADVKLTAAEAIKQGLALDGGLFVPTEIPTMTMEEIESLTDKSYAERAYDVLSKFLTDYSEQELKACITNAYGTGFDVEEVAPVKVLDGGRSCLELWHGPTSAFKDMALQILPHLLVNAIEKTGEKSKIVILTATSGDTGKAALEGFKDVKGTGIIVFYPVSGVSKIQKRQMATQEGNNVFVMSVEGNFDDAQTGVKRVFGDKEFNEKLNAEGCKLSSANSINWGRLAPQIVYYFSGYADMVKNGEISLGEEINVTVPTGNFGNILAGYFAKQMGLPIKKFICASNSNKILTDFFKTGTYDRNRDFLKTASPSMDILISSNLERLLYLATKDCVQVAEWMKALNENGKYEVSADVFGKLTEDFYGNWADEQETLAAIEKEYKSSGYVIDTHTAVAFSVTDKYMAETGDTTKTLIVSTASPYKFCESVLEAVSGEIVVEEEDIFKPLDTLNALTGVKIPEGLAGLKGKEVIFSDVCQKEEMIDVVDDCIKNKFSEI